MSMISPTSCHTFNSTCHGVTSLISDPYQTTLYASCTDNRIYAYDSVRLKHSPVNIFSGHLNSTFYVKSAISCCGRFLLSGSSCGNAHIWDTQNPQTPPTLLIGHDKEVTAVAWSPYQLDKIVTCSDACNFRIWRALIDDKRREEEQLIGYAERSSIKQVTKTSPEARVLNSIENITPPTTPVITTPIVTPPSNSRSSTIVTKYKRRKSSSCAVKLSTPKRSKKCDTKQLLTTNAQKTITSFYSTPKLVK